MTVAGAGAAPRVPDPNAGQTPAQDLPPDQPADSAAVAAPGPARKFGPGQQPAPPFSWLGSDAWPNFPVSADKGS
jgi:hypothetical protein